MKADPGGPKWLVAFTVSTIVAGALGGWQFIKYRHGYGLFHSISPRYGWIPLLLVVVAIYVYLFRAALRDKDL